jgi:hypothetical protein
MKRFLPTLAITAIAILSATKPVNSQPNPTEYETYVMAKYLILNYDEKPQDFRKYTVQWLDQDKSFPDRHARSYCTNRMSGGSHADFVTASVNKQLQLTEEQQWSEPRQKAMVFITSASIVLATHHYCPEFGSP